MDEKNLSALAKRFSEENQLRSRWELLATLGAVGLNLLAFQIASNIYLDIPFALIQGLLYVRIFVIYHDYRHEAIFRRSKLAGLFFTLYGYFILAPKTVWTRSHNHHHSTNGRLSNLGIGSYPTISTLEFEKLRPLGKVFYLVNRHPITILCGYFTLFIFWLNLRSVLQSPRKHLDSLLALSLHLLASISIYLFFGAQAYWIYWFLPFFIAFATGAYLFYCQHNFPGISFKVGADWSYYDAALNTTSFLKLNPVMNWFTANIGYHHIHHVNAKIPFYRLPEAMNVVDEFQSPHTITLSLRDIRACLALKLWDPEQNKMVPVHWRKFPAILGERSVS